MEHQMHMSFKTEEIYDLVWEAKRLPFYVSTRVRTRQRDDVATEADGTIVRVPTPDDRSS